MKMRKNLILATILAVLSPTILMASEEAHHHLPPINEFFSSLTYFWINFVAYVGLISYFIRKPFSKVWASRREKLEQQIFAGKSQLEAADAEIAAAQGRLSELPKLLGQLDQRLETDVQSEISRITTEAMDRSEKIKEQANQTAAAERRAAKQNFEDRLVLESLARAREKLKGIMSPEVDARIRNRTLDALPVVESLN